MSMSPKYYQLYEKIRAQILNGQLQANAQLPTEEDLCARYDVSRGTVRKAFDALVTEGLIRREQGRGNFVNAPKPSLGAFVLANQPRPLHDKIIIRTLKREMHFANEEAASRLNVDRGAVLLFLAQIQSLNGTPILYETRLFDYYLCPGLVEDEDFDTQPFHELLVYKYNVPLVRVTHTIESRTLSAPEASLLEMTAGESVFDIDRLTYTTHKNIVQPAVWYRALCRGDYYQFKLEFLSFL